MESGTLAPPPVKKRTKLGRATLKFDGESQTIHGHKLRLAWVAPDNRSVVIQLTKKHSAKSNSVRVDTNPAVQDDLELHAEVKPSPLRADVVLYLLSD